MKYMKYNTVVDYILNQIDKEMIYLRELCTKYKSTED